MTAPRSLSASAPPTPYRFYWAGELFSYKHLLGNAVLAAEIEAVSASRFLPILPQDLEFRSDDPHDIRDQDLLALLSCDLALFQFDGQELDSGTVVEFMFAKFADIPAVILRTDFRASGDQGPESDPWNLMASFYPRTKVLVKSALAYASQSGHQTQDLRAYQRETLLHNVQSQREALALLAREICDSFEAVLEQPPILTAQDAEGIYRYLSQMPNFKRPLSEVRPLIKDALARRQRLYHAAGGDL